MQLGACVPNFYVQESFDETNDAWSRAIVDEPVLQKGGFVEVRDRPGLGIELDWERLAAHPYERQHLLRLFTPGWEKRGGGEVQHGGEVPDADTVGAQGTTGGDPA
jgi:galactonate dehydratase